MILAEKIMEERKRNGWSQEELADMLSVSRQSVSKWESAQATPDLSKIIKLAEIFGVSTDYLLKDEIDLEKDLPIVAGTETTAVRTISMEEANEFMSLKEMASKVVSNGVSLCIISPALLIFLFGFSETKKFGVTEEVATVLGIVSLLLLVAMAVYQFITTGMKLKKYEYLEIQNFETAYGVNGLVKEKKEKFSSTYASGIAIGVVMCIVSTVPLITASIMELEDYVVCGLVSLLLVIVAIGVNFIIRVSTIHESYEMLLQEADYSKAEKGAKRKLDPVVGMYWSVATVIYLVWSFISSDWQFTWIIWPIAGVLYAALISIIKGFLVKAE